MPAQNYVLLNRIELNASAASVTFSNIPQTGYTDLKIVYSLRSDNGDDYFALTFNGSSSTFTSRDIQGGGTSATSASRTDNLFVFTQDPSSMTANTFSNGELYIPNYLGSTNKSFSQDTVYENNATGAGMALRAGLWSTTSAISSIGIAKASGNFVQYSTFSLYGLAALGTTPTIAPKASGGNIQTDGTYWYHTFLTTGAFVPATTLNADVLTIAGGGGGGAWRAGGGGAGEIRYATSQSVSANSYTVTVGAGGAGGIATGNTSVDNRGSTGSNSVLPGFVTANGGGGGGCYQDPRPTTNSNGKSGGSGGGASLAGSGGAVSSGSGGTGYGFAGSNDGGSTGGGGGAGSSSGNNNGGAGLNTWSSWATTTATGVSGYYAGGGGGSYSGTGGSGGGGNGDSTGGSGRTAGTTNTGGGGGGSYNNNDGMPGGSGIVIIRYLMAA
jgi:hypothetical protein